MMHRILHLGRANGAVQKFSLALFIPAFISDPAISQAQTASVEVACTSSEGCSVGIDSRLPRYKAPFSSRVIDEGYPVFVRSISRDRVVPISEISIEGSMAFYRSVLSALESLYQDNVIPKDTRIVVDSYPTTWFADSLLPDWAESKTPSDAVSPWVWVSPPDSNNGPVEVHILQSDIRMIADLGALKGGEPFSPINKPFMDDRCSWATIASYMKLTEQPKAPDEFERWAEDASCLAEPLREPFYYIMTISPGPGIAPFPGDVRRTTDLCLDEMEGFYAHLLSGLIPAAVNRATSVDEPGDDWWIEVADRTREEFADGSAVCK